MFIENKQYRTDNLSVINDLRRILFSLYSNTSNIMNIQENICRYINCDEIEFSPNDFTFIVRVNRNQVNDNFKHCPDFYYSIICNIFKDFVASHEQEVLKNLRCLYADAYGILQSIYNNHHIMANLCHITCIHDDILFIKL